MGPTIKFNIVTAQDINGKTQKNPIKKNGAEKFVGTHEKSQLHWIIQLKTNLKLGFYLA